MRRGNLIFTGEFIRSPIGGTLFAMVVGQLSIESIVPNYETDLIFVTASCESFDDMAEGELTPTYEVSFKQTNRGFDILYGRVFQSLPGAWPEIFHAGHISSIGHEEEISS